MSVWAAIAIVEGVGIDAARARVIHDGSSVFVGFGAGGPVARVGGLTASVRDLRATYSREVALAGHLAALGAPVVHPWQPAGPFEHAGHVVSLWHEAKTGSPVAPTAAGQALRRCHAALREFTGPLPPLSSLIDEAQRILDRVAIAAQDRQILARAIPYARHVLAHHGLPEQPLHGDAGLGNVLEGGVWHDWEDSCRGPLIWDLASMVSTARITGRDPQRAEATLRAYGDAPGLEQLDAFIAIRGLYVLAWSLLGSAKEGQMRITTQARLRWLRSRPWPA